MQVALHNHVLHALHSLVQEVGIGGVGEVDICILLRISYEIPELSCEELLSSLNISVAASIIWEMVSNRCRSRLNLFSKQVNLVEKEDERGLLEVFAVRYTLEKHQGLVHLVL